MALDHEAGRVVGSALNPPIHYVAIVEGKTRNFSVFFPDVPGCTSAGRSLEETVVNAAEALSGHAALLVEDGVMLPQPRSVDAILKDKEWAPFVEGCVAILVPLMRRERVVRANISMEDGLLRRIDAEAEVRGMTRSGFLALAARQAITGSSKPSFAKKPTRRRA